LKPFKGWKQRLEIQMNNRNAPVIIFLFLLTASYFSCAHLKDARQSFEEKNYTRTISLCKKAIMNDSTDVDAYLLLGKSYRSSDSLILALHTMERAHQLQSESPVIIRELTQINILLGDKAVLAEDGQQALSYYEAAEALSPTHPDAMKKIAEIYVNNGKLDKAKLKYETLLSVAPDSITGLRLAEINHKIASAISLYEEGLKALKSYRYRTARALFQKAINEKSDFTDAYYHLYMTEGHILFKQATQKDYWDAITAYGKAAAIRTEGAEPHYFMAIAYEKKDPDEFINAIEAYEKALHLEPEDPFSKTCEKKIKELKTRKEKLEKFWGRKK